MRMSRYACFSLWMCFLLLQGCGDESSQEDVSHRADVGKSVAARDLMPMDPEYHYPGQNHISKAIADKPEDEQRKLRGWEDDLRFASWKKNHWLVKLNKAQVRLDRYAQGLEVPEVDLEAGVQLLYYELANENEFLSIEFEAIDQLDWKSLKGHPEEVRSLCVALEHHLQMLKMHYKNIVNTRTEMLESSLFKRDGL